MATNFQIEKQSSDEVMVIGLEQSTVFNLKIKNLEKSDNFEFYNLLGFNMFPKGRVYFKIGETKEIELKISPIGRLKNYGYYTFTYFIRGENSSEIQEQLTFKIIELEELFRVGTSEINPEPESIRIYIENKENINLTDVHAEFSSPFFKFEKTFDIGPNENKEFVIDLNKDDFRGVTAGFYTLRTDVKIGEETARIEGAIKFNEKDNIITTKKDYGFIIHTQVLERVNEGNVIATSETVFKKNVISRLFTTFSPEPDFVEREGLVIDYIWNRQIKPGETLEIVVKTNWLFPLLAILLMITTVILAKQHTGTNLILRKKVSFVRSKGGEFALKVTIFAKAKRYLERVNIIDRLPMLVKVHERFGTEQPTRVSEKTRRIEWNFEKLEQGEVRVLSYIIYSKIGILGKFALPSATAIFERDGKIKEAISNRAFFMAEQRAEKKKDEDEDLF